MNNPDLVYRCPSCDIRVHPSVAFPPTKLTCGNCCVRLLPWIRLDGDLRELAERLRRCRGQDEMTELIALLDRRWEAQPPDEEEPGD